MMFAPVAPKHWQAVALQQVAVAAVFSAASCSVTLELPSQGYGR